jgi:DnaK suppressor protein
MTTEIYPFSYCFGPAILLRFLNLMKKSEADSHDVYRRMLEQKRAEVIASLGSKVDTLSRLGRVAEDDQAQVSHDEFVSLRLNSLDYSQLRLIQEALDRMNSGDYGICLACEEPIPAKRLRAVSWARYCVGCQDTIGRMMDLELAEREGATPAGRTA